jgi:hypothetical protein
MEPRPDFYGNCFEAVCAFCDEVLLVGHKEKIHMVYEDGVPCEDPSKRYACYKCGKEREPYPCRPTSVHIKIPKKLRHLFPPLD